VEKGYVLIILTIKDLEVERNTKRKEEREKGARGVMRHDT
jgi:hypothetical protein